MFQINYNNTIYTVTSYTVYRIGIHICIGITTYKIPLIVLNSIYSFNY